MAELVTDEPVVRLTAESQLTCGQLVIVPDGRVGIVQNKKPVDVGEVASVRIRGIIKAKAGSAMQAGDRAAAHIANQTIIATGGAGTDCGQILYDVTIGKDAFVDLNT
jgi:hypothetical protein